LSFRGADRSKWECQIRMTGPAGQRTGFYQISEKISVESGTKGLGRGSRRGHVVCLAVLTIERGDHHRSAN
jgi:hypothetical protein